jgi:hypothetical protein
MARKRKKTTLEPTSTRAVILALLLKMLLAAWIT